MVGTVNFNYQFMCQTNKICNEITNDVLSSKPKRF